MPSDASVNNGVNAKGSRHVATGALVFRGGGREGLKWHSNYSEAWALAEKENKLLFIDFTGVQCANCRSNEEKIFPNPGT